jgi:hypothetical protein
VTVLLANIVAVADEPLHDPYLSRAHVLGLEPAE